MTMLDGAAVRAGPCRSPLFGPFEPPRNGTWPFIRLNVIAATTMSAIAGHDRRDVAAGRAEAVRVASPVDGGRRAASRPMPPRARSRRRAGASGDRPLPRIAAASRGCRDVATSRISSWSDSKPPNRRLVRRADDVDPVALTWTVVARSGRPKAIPSSTSSSRRSVSWLWPPVRPRDSG